MSVDLRKYLNSRSDRIYNKVDQGPVVTISRQFGCMAQPIVDKLLKRLNDEASKNYGQKWNLISKEVIHEAAEELRIHPQQIHDKLSKIEIGILDEIWNSFSHEWQVSTEKITRTLRNVLETYTKRGHIVAMGMGGAVLAHDIEHSLHIRLVAPIEWRVKNVYASRGLNKEKALAFVQKQDKRRNALLAQLSGKPYDSSLFDVVLNRLSFSENEIVDIIYGLMRRKKLIP